ncbi:MAG: type IV pilin protein [Lysobacterales bacterium]
MKVSLGVGKPGRARGVTLVELVIVVALISILMGTAIPSYRGYVQRVHRTEAIRLLLQAAMCQQRHRAEAGSYDTTRCTPASGSGRYQFAYESPDAQAQRFVARAIPQGVQRSDPCGSLSLDQNGERGTSAAGASTSRCWSGR